ncbi:hypothetical protein RRF57_010556 [Xylaria bambusicola]|uniref:Uncharacterized protein n=1 Tax=Xylaria bambusicola TaxID=326684 RepID=A0AAN7USK0_9PEZI
MDCALIDISSPDSLKRFFNEVILTTESARDWLATHLTVASQLVKADLEVFDPPKIWMSSSIYLIEDTAAFICLASHPESATFSLPSLDTSDIAALLALDINATVGICNT